MLESDKVRHILKGIGPVAFNHLAVQNPATIGDVVTTCQRLDTLDSFRLQPDIGDHHSTSHGQLRDLIRDIIREEFRSMGFTPSTPRPSQSSGVPLRDIVKEELTSLTGSAPAQPPSSRPIPTYPQVSAVPPSDVHATLPLPTYVSVAAAPPVNYRSMPPDPPSVHLTALSPAAPNAFYSPPWRSSRPVCYYSGYHGHISHFCRKRQQDERRSTCVNRICTAGPLIKVDVIRLPRTGLHLLRHRLHHRTAETRDATHLRPSAVPLLYFGPPHSPLMFIRKSK
ncbi:uncharacterized protein LOC142772961 isoform X1 [Rhipicephalus microplus]|uniref:uncharacterized protein LOC142772961 isoform X1 n=1 Tax=Rhipicephalus microplus TaxID=6941 RepID=UPI003F6D73AB